MKAAKLITVLSIFAFLIFGVSTNSFASAQDHEKNLSHEALANQYENLAQEMLAKVDEKKAALMSKPNSSYFGKTGINQKARLKNKISKYEKAAIEYSQKASYHQKIAAEQIDGRSVAKLNQGNQQINKGSL
mgnify:CR=1 FL=1